MEEALIKVVLIIVGVASLIGLTAIILFIATGTMKAFKVVYPYARIWWRFFVRLVKICPNKCNVCKKV